MKVTAEEGQEFELIPEGSIVASTLVKVEATSYVWDGRTIEQFTFLFKVTEPGYDDLFIKGNTSRKFTVDPPSNLYKWSCTVLGRTFELGDALDTDDLKNVPCRILVGRKADRKIEGKWWHTVEEVLPPRAASSTAGQVFG